MRSFRYRILLESPLHIGSGIGGHGCDDWVVRDGANRPTIPATTVKGASRDALNRAYGATKEAHRVYGRGDADDWQGGEVWFSDAVSPLAPTAIRPSIALNEHRTARTGFLSEIELVLPVSAGETTLVTFFEGTVELRPGVPGDRDAAALRLVAEGLARIETLGSKTSRGLGRVRVALHPDCSELLGEGATP